VLNDKIFPFLYETPSTLPVHGSQLQAPILSQTNPVYINICHFQDINFNLNFRSTPRSFEWPSLSNLSGSSRTNTNLMKWEDSTTVMTTAV
jgi:hypothetical protein